MIHTDLKKIFLIFKQQFFMVEIMLFCIMIKNLSNNYIRGKKFLRVFYK